MDLTPGAVFLACGQVVGDLLRGRNHPTVVAWAQGLAAIFTVVLLIALLPIVGVYGAAIASTAAYGAALAVMLHSLRHLPRHARGSGWSGRHRDGCLRCIASSRYFPAADSQRNHTRPEWQ